MNTNLTPSSTIYHSPFYRFCISATSFLYRTRPSLAARKRIIYPWIAVQPCKCSFFYSLILPSYLKEDINRICYVWTSFHPDSGLKASCFAFPIKISNFNNVLVLDCRAQNPMGTIVGG